MDDNAGPHRSKAVTAYGSRLTNGSCAMSLNSNHVVLNIVFIDVGLPTVDV
jgi:hypothetical protein